MITSLTDTGRLGRGLRSMAAVNVELSVPSFVWVHDGGNIDEGYTLNNNSQTDSYTAPERPQGGMVKRPQNPDIYGTRAYNDTQYMIWGHVWSSLGPPLKFKFTPTPVIMPL